MPPRRDIATVDAAAENAAGQALGAPYEFSFTTPTVRLTSARWRRQGDRFDRPLALALAFNQPVRPADVVAHVTARYRRHDFSPPTLTGAERARMMGEDPLGVRRLDEKLAAARQAAARTDVVPLRLAASWDRKAFPPSDTLVVPETVGTRPSRSRCPTSRPPVSNSSSCARSPTVSAASIRPRPANWATRACPARRGSKRTWTCSFRPPSRTRSPAQTSSASRCALRLVAEGADGPVTDEADRLLGERGVTVLPGFLANAGGVTSSYFVLVQSNAGYYWERDEVLGKLDVKMTAAYAATRDLARKRAIPLRDAAHLIAVSAGGAGCRERGWT